MLNWLARALGFVWLGLLTFIIVPERLRLLNGTLEAGRRDNQWIVTAELPRSEPENVA